MISSEIFEEKELKLQDVFGLVLKEQRQKAGLSQENLAFEAGFNRTFVSMMERGLRQPTLTTLFKLGKALKIPPFELVKLVEKDFPVNQIDQENV